MLMALPETMLGALTQNNLALLLSPKLRRIAFHSFFFQHFEG